MMVQSNILDPVHPILDPTVWDNVHDIPVLKAQHRLWLIDTITRVLSHHGYGDIDKWLELYLTGSLTTYQYSDNSDCDVSLFVNTDVFPEWSRAEMIGIMISELEIPLPGTNHPVQGYVVAKGIRPTDLYKPGLRSAWSINHDRWIVPPEHERVHNVDSEYNGFYVYALEQADKMDRLLRYEPDKAVQFWHQIHSRRMADMKAGKGDYSESNIVYKFLANRGLFDQISEVSGEHIASGWTDYYRQIEQENAGMQIDEPWTPGHSGKCFMADGQVHSWNTDAPPDKPSVGVPHHTWVRDQLGAQEMKGSGWIFPDGRVVFPYLGKDDDADEMTLETIIEHIPGTRRDESVNPRTASIKGLIFPDGTTDHWSVTNLHDPHHMHHPRWEESVKSFTIHPNLEAVVLAGGHPTDTITPDQAQAIIMQRYPNLERVRDIEDKVDDWGHAFAKTSAAINPFFVDHRAVEMATRHPSLNLKHPAEVRLVKGTHGSYEGLQDGRHIVNVVGWLTPESASKQIWHELSHAKQFEKDPDNYEKHLDDYWETQALGHSAYSEHPWEQEAQALAAQHPFPLALPRVENRYPRTPLDGQQPASEPELALI